MNKKRRSIDGRGARSAPFDVLMSPKRRVRARPKLNIFGYEISLSCGKFRKHDREPCLDKATHSIRGLPVHGKDPNKKTSKYYEPLLLYSL